MSLKLSIITVNLNNASGLKKTMESVFFQTSRDFEYIVIDGGSSDGSKEIILEFEKQNSDELLNIPFTCISEPDQGIYNAMNKGIRISKGEYCQFLNSGDWLVNKEVTSLMLNDLPDSNIVYANMLKQMTNGEILSNKKIRVNSFLTFYTGSLNHPSEYIKRSLFDKYGLYDENLKIVSDWKFNLIAIILNNESVSYRNINLTYFDMNGISSTNKELDRTERKRVFEQLITPGILTDYDNYADLLVRMKRINRFGITRYLFRFIERVLFRFEKWETHLKKEHIQY